LLTIHAGERQYELVEGWGEIPRGWEWGQVGGVAVDSQDQVHVFTRAEHPYRVYDRSGRLLFAWGDEILMDAHGIFIGSDDSVYLVDRGPHLVLKFSSAGQHLMSLGKRDNHSDTGWSDENRRVSHAAGPFHLPTDVAVSAGGDVYVSDGYGNCRVHRYSSEGELSLSWGEPGAGPGQFNLVHSVWEREGRVYVADRENNRIQIFTSDGVYLDSWSGFLRPSKIFVDRDAVMYVAELGARVSILDLEGNVLGRLGGRSEADLFVAPHGVWTDSRGDLYVAEVKSGRRIQKVTRSK
jgi:DNA-binding beta-propeller fold protein YncE